jgi:hypothetical protein
MNVKKIVRPGEKRFKLSKNLQDYSIAVVFSFLPKQKNCNLASGFIFMEARKNDGSTVHYKEFLLTVDENELRTFYKSAKTFIELCRQISNISNLDDALDLFQKDENSEKYFSCFSRTF